MIAPQSASSITPGSVLSMNSLQHGRERVRVLEVGEVGCAGQRLEAAVRGRARARARPCSSGIVWSRSPQTIRVGIALEQVEAVLGADALAVDVDHRAQRLQERLARAGILQRAERPRDGLQRRRLAVPAGSRIRLPGRARARRARAGGRRAHSSGRHAGQRRAAQQRADLAAQAAARHEHEPLDPLGELVEELHRHAAAERVARRSSRGRFRSPRAGRGCWRRGRPASSRRAAPPSRRGRSGPGRSPCGRSARLQRDRSPVARGVDHPVDQHDGRPAAGHAVDHAMAVQLDLPRVEFARDVLRRLGRAQRLTSGGTLSSAVGAPETKGVLNRP